MKTLLTLILVLFYVQAYSQGYDVYKVIIESDFSIDNKIEHIDLLIDIELKKDSLTNYFRITDDYISWLYTNNKIDKSISTLLSSINKTSIQDQIELEVKRYKLAFIYRKTGKYEKSFIYHKKILTSKTTDHYYLKSITNIAYDYNKSGDYQLSRKYFDLAEKELLSRKDYKRLIRNTALSSNAYEKFSDQESRSKFELKLLFADSLTQNIEVPFRTLFNIKISLLNFYTEYENRDTNKGSKYSEQALPLAKQQKDSILIASSLLSTSILWNIDAPEKSIKFLNEALIFCPKHKISLKSSIYANLGLNKTKTNLLDQAIEDQHTALELLIGKSLKNISEDSTTLLSSKDSNYNLWIFLTNLAETYYLKYKESSDSNDLQKSIQFFKHSDLVIEDYFNSDVSIASKLLWRTKGTQIYSRALRSCYAANDIKSALFFMEKSKSLLLYEEIANFKKSQALNISDTLLLKEKNLKTKLNRLERLQTTQPDSLKKIITIQDSLNILSKIIKAEYPGYKEINEFSSLSNIQEQLKDDEVVLEYHISADNGFGIAPNTQTGYGLLITPNNTHLFEINDQDALKSDVNVLLKQLNSKQHNQADITQHKKLSISLFNKLVPTHIKEHLQGKKLTIIPDNYLSKLPFEALITSGTNEDTRYFIQDNEIHYEYSAGFKQLLDHTNNDDKEHILTAFASVHFIDAPTLSHSYEEVTMLNEHIKTNLYINENASKDNFFNSLETSKIIHLATHATIDNNDPLIQFSDGSIHLDEISTLSNNASLVTLSACETTIGEIVDGEGILSLARGFFYGGAQATLSSLWQVDDKATYTIMDGFYKHLSEGDTKAAALRKAKIEYLDTHSGSESSPYYWSSFILTGAVDPIATGNNHWIYYLGIGIFFLGSVLFMLSRKRNTRS